jgi:hypothetical protein
MYIKDRRLDGLELVGLGLAALCVLLALHAAFSKWRENLTAELRRLAPHLERVSGALETADSLYTLRARDVRSTKKAMTGLARKQKTYYEERLALAEERRLLEKQLELLETRFVAADGKLKAVRAERVSQEFGLAGQATCWAEEGAPSVVVPASAQVTAKEFYAHPERGKVEMKDGTLIWTPPQVGTVSRQEGLGQYVLFTNTSLVVHLPPRDKVAHESYAHCCLPLDKKTAKSAYDAVFIGARLALQAEPATGASPLTPLAPAAAGPSARQKGR